MKLVTLAGLLAFSVFATYAEAEVDVNVRQASSIPSKKTIKKKAPVVNSGTNAEQVMSENPFAGGTGGAGKQNAGHYFGDLTSDEDSSMFSHGKDGWLNSASAGAANAVRDPSKVASPGAAYNAPNGTGANNAKASGSGTLDEWLKRVATGPANTANDASKVAAAANTAPSAAGTGAASNQKSIRQMTEELAQNLSKNGGDSLKDILNNPAIRQASETFAKSLSQNQTGDNKNTSGNSLRELSQQMMKNLDMKKVQEVMKDINLDDILKNIPKADSKPPLDDILKNLMGTPKATDGATPEGERPKVDFGSLFDGLFGDVGKKGPNGNVDASSKPKPNWDDFFDFDNLFNDYGDL